ncbi:MAG: glycoside hydrolase family 3 protein [Oscillospiraceae bacterium]|nr:glycoside hydrolase family 3 protein [Oscillospiraceae bacterium]
MKKLKNKLGKMAQRIIDKAMGNGLMQEETSASGERYVTPGIGPLIRQAGAEGCVLLKNDGALPLNRDKEVAVFGRCQLDWFYVGYGSGGDVNAPYHVNLIDGLRNAGLKLNADALNAYETWTQQEDNMADHGWWGHWPMNYPEMPLDDALVQKAAQTAETAIVVIGRAAGEDRENTLTKGSFYLTDEERVLLDAVTAAFSRVVVLLNIGNIIDLAWTEEYGDKLSALMIVWQSGMESGNAVADVLTGAVIPCGKLSDTIARRYEDYPSCANFGGKEFNDYAEGIYVGYRYFDRHPDKVLYPFGFGLSYTCFTLKSESLERRENETEAVITVTNTGTLPGKEVVQLWCHAPAGRLDKPLRVLVAFGKTKALAPGESETLRLCCDDKCLASYDEESSRFILESGEYRFTANGTETSGFTLDEEITVEQCEPLCKTSAELRERILSRLPKAVPVTGIGSYTLDDVKSGKIGLDDFIARLSDKELEALSRGHGMMGSSLGVAGNAGAFGGVIESLRKKGVPPIITSDGPAGLRLKKYCALQPCGTALACTWNTDLIEALSAKIGEEMIHYGVDVQLAPGMNIHRNPLCGRNFEYFSEDPLLSGKMAAATVRGVQSKGRAACPKHFACNNQETNRNRNDSRVSERALREIYLRNFEIVVKEAKPLTIMTSYNKVNGVWSHYNYDLVTTVLRGEWAYTGCVITDWWMQKSKSPEFPKLKNNAYRVRAQVDVLMPGDIGHLAKQYKSDGSLLETLGQADGISRAELQRTARSVLTLAMKLKM